MEPIIRQVFTEEEADEIFEFLLSKDVEYHKPFKRFNKTVKVPRGQASYTISDKIHYNYGVSGGSPVNEVMDERLLRITEKVHKVLGRIYNTILMNVYKNGKDNIALHKDKATHWVEGTGFCTVAFGQERVFLLEEIATKEKTRIIHKKGYAIELPYPMNSLVLHGVPPCSTENCRISLTFREIKATIN